MRIEDNRHKMRFGDFLIAAPVGVVAGALYALYAIGIFVICAVLVAIPLAIGTVTLWWLWNALF